MDKLFMWAKKLYFWWRKLNQQYAKKNNKYEVYVAAQINIQCKTNT